MNFSGSPTTKILLRRGWLALTRPGGGLRRLGLHTT